jgi:hypothetical protein
VGDGEATGARGDNEGGGEVGDDHMADNKQGCTMDFDTKAECYVTKSKFVHNTTRSVNITNKSVVAHL